MKPIEVILAVILTILFLLLQAYVVMLLVNFFFFVTVSFIQVLCVLIILTAFRIFGSMIATLIKLELEGDDEE